MEEYKMSTYYPACSNCGWGEFEIVESKHKDIIILKCVECGHKMYLMKVEVENE